jgi:hypothetical protein
MISSASHRTALSGAGGRTAITMWLNPAAITSATMDLAATASSPAKITCVDLTTCAGSQPIADTLSRQFLRALQILASRGNDPA